MSLALIGIKLWLTNLVNYRQLLLICIPTGFIIYGITLLFMKPELYKQVKTSVTTLVSKQV